MLDDGALQPVIGLLSSKCPESQREAALLLGQFATAEPDYKAKIVQRGAVPPLIVMLRAPDAALKEMAAFALGRLAQNQDNQVKSLDRCTCKGSWQCVKDALHHMHTVRVYLGGLGVQGLLTFFTQDQTSYRKCGVRLHTLLEISNNVISLSTVEWLTDVQLGIST